MVGSTPTAPGLPSRARAAALVGVLVLFRLPVIGGGWLLDESDRFAVITQTACRARLLDCFHGSGFLFRPVSLISLRTSLQLFGFDPEAARPWLHLESLLLFGAVLWVFARGLSRLTTETEAFLATALVGLHPATVPTAAWISDRTDSLTMLLTLLAAWAFARGWSASGRTRERIAALVLWALSLMCKEQQVGLVAVALAYVWLAGGSRLARVAWSAAWAGTTVGAMLVVEAMAGPRHNGWVHGFADRLVLVLETIGFYVRTALFPTDATLYRFDLDFANGIDGELLVLGATGLLLWLLLGWSVRRDAVLRLAWAWTTCVAATIVNVVPIPNFTVAAYRLCWLLAGVSVLAARGLLRLPSTRVRALALAAVLGLFAIQSERSRRAWVNVETLTAATGAAAAARGE